VSTGSSSACHKEIDAFVSLDLGAWYQGASLNTAWIGEWLHEYIDAHTHTHTQTSSSSSSSSFSSSSLGSIPRLTVDPDSQYCANNSYWQFLPVAAGAFDPVSIVATARDATLRRKLATKYAVRGFNLETTWSTSCYDLVKGTMNYNSTDRSVQVYMQGVTPSARAVREGFCADDLVIATSYANKHAHLSFPNSTSAGVDIRGLSDTNVQDIIQNGINVLVLPCGTAGTLLSVEATLGLFNGSTVETEEKNFQFLLERGLYPDLQVFNTTQGLDKWLIRSGSLLSVTGFDGGSTLIQWATGGHTAHSAMLVWDKGHLYVTESHYPSITRTRYDDWIANAIGRYRAVAYIPIAKTYADQFDSDAYWNFFNEVAGMPYGFHNFLFVILDTYPSQNLPLPVTEGNFVYMINALSHALPNQTTPDQWWTMEYLVVDGLNHRLGTECTPKTGGGAGLDCIYEALLNRDLSLSQVMAMPEQDAWMYGKQGYANYSMVCSAFAFRGWKAALGDMLPPGIEGTEQSPKDNYMTALFEPDHVNRVNCRKGYSIAADSETAYCQVMGLIKIPLKGLNTILPYQNMSNGCASQWPEYVRCPGDEPEPCKC
jgi:hypothetical protein